MAVFVVHRGVVDTATVQRLSAGLIMLVYLYLAVSTGRTGPNRTIVGAVGLLPVLVWVVRPGLFEASEIALGPGWRRAGVLIGAAAVGLLYASMRRRRARTEVQVAAAVAFAAALALASANWIVSVSAAVCVATCLAVSLAGASRGGAPPPPPDQPDTPR